AAGAGGHEQLATWRGAVPTRGISGRTKRIRSFGFASRTARRTTTGRIVKSATCVKLLLTTRKDERRIAIAACERFVCVLHADSRKKEVVEVVATRTSYVGARWLDESLTALSNPPPVAPKKRIAKLCFQPRASIRGRVKPRLRQLVR